LKRLFLKSEGRLSILGWIVLLLLTIIPPTMLSDTIDVPEWVDFAIFIVWFIIVSYVARRAWGVRV
jgi:hypothetical protein